MGIYNTCILKNISVSDLIVRGQIIEASGGTYEITDEERQWFAFDIPLQTLINSGDIVVNDGTNDLSIADGLELLRLNYTADAVRIQNTRIDASGIGNQRVLNYESSPDRVKYTDLSQIGGSGRTIELVLVKNETTPFLQTTSNSYVTLAYVVFPGTGNAGPPSLTTIICWSAQNNKNSDYRLYDLDNAQVLTEIIGVNDNIEGTKRTMTQINPYPITATTIEVQARKGSAPKASATIAAVEIAF